MEDKKNICPYYKEIEIQEYTKSKFDYTGRFLSSTPSVDGGVIIKKIKSVCAGTKNQDRCSCGGNRERCMLNSRQSKSCENTEHKYNKLYSDKDVKRIMKNFAEQIKMRFYYNFDEIIPSIMSDEIDKLLDVDFDE